MTYSISGIDPQLVQAAANDPAAVLVKASSRPGFPCRVTLDDAAVGEDMLLFHHVSHDVGSPYRSAYAIYARPGAQQAAHYIDTIPPAFVGRPLGMRAFDSDAMLRAAALALPGTADEQIRRLLTHDAIAYIDVHNAAHGCFVARVERFAQ
jgi:hypothetical protein